MSDNMMATMINATTADFIVKLIEHNYSLPENVTPEAKFEAVVNTLEKYFWNRMSSAAGKGEQKLMGMTQHITKGVYPTVLTFDVKREDAPANAPVQG